jgi:hypothetical protein
VFPISVIFRTFLKVIAFKKVRKVQKRNCLGDWIIVSNPLIIAGNPTYGQLHDGWVIAGNRTYGQLHTGWVIAGNLQLTHRGNRGLSFAAVTGRTTGYPGLPGGSDFCDFSTFFEGYSLQKSAKSSETQYFLSDWIIVSNLLIIAGNPTYVQLHDGWVIAGNRTYGQLHAGWVIAGNRTYGQLHTGWVIAGNRTYGQLRAGWVIAGNLQLTYRVNPGSPRVYPAHPC